MIRKIKLNPFKHDNAGETNQIELPIDGKEIIGVLLRAEGDNNGSPATFAELVDNTRVEIDGVEKWDIDPVLYPFANEYLNISGDTTRTDTLAIKFDSPIAGGARLGTKNVGQILINNDLKADAGNVTYSKMTATLIYKPGASNRGAIIRDKMHKHTTAVQGENVVDDLPVRDLDILSMLIIDSPHVQKVEFLHGDEKIIDITKQDLDGYYSEEPFVNNPGFANRFMLRFDDFADIKEAIPLAGGGGKRIPITLKYTFDTGQAVPANGIPILIRGVENQ